MHLHKWGMWKDIVVHQPGQPDATWDMQERLCLRCDKKVRRNCR